jgi:hypothetical protein
MMVSLSLSEDQFEILGYALKRARRAELANAATCGRRKVRDSSIERARRIAELRVMLDCCALPEPDHP